MKTHLNIKDIVKQKKVKITILLIIIITLIITVISLYIAEENFREWIDINILRKNITEEGIVSIDLNSEKNNQIYVYSKYIALLNNQTITIYNTDGKEEKSIDININNALFDANEKYLVVAEDGGEELCLILEKTYLWSNKIEGEILQVHVNRNGYVAVVSKDTTYKSIITLYNSDGTELFKSYFSYTRVIDASISQDNKYVAVGELDSSGTLIQSNIKILSVENAKNDPENTIIYTYNADSGRLITNINYQAKDRLVCMYDNQIDVISNEENKQIISTENSEITFMSSNLSNNIVYIEEEKSGLFTTDVNIKIVGTQNEETHIYNLDEVPKELYTNGNVIAVNTGTDIYFLNTSGGLIKKYSTHQEISNVMFSNSVAIIIYKDKIIIIDL